MRKRRGSDETEDARRMSVPSRVRSLTVARAKSKCHDEPSATSGGNGPEDHERSSRGAVPVVSGVTSSARASDVESKRDSEREKEREREIFTSLAEVSLEVRLLAVEL